MICALVFLAGAYLFASAVYVWQVKILVRGVR